MRKLLLLAGFVSLLVFVGSVEPASAQCAMCRTALEQNGGKLVQGFDRAIIFLLVMPYLVFGSAILYWYWKRSRRQAQTAKATAPAAGRDLGAVKVPTLLEETGS